MSQTTGQHNSGQSSKWDDAAASGKTITIPTTANTLAKQLQDAGIVEQVRFSGNQPTDTSQGIKVRFTSQAKGKMSQYADQLDQAGAQISDDNASSMGTQRS